MVPPYWQPNPLEKSNTWWWHRLIRTPCLYYLGFFLEQSWGITVLLLIATKSTTYSCFRTQNQLFWCIHTYLFFAWWRIVCCCFVPKQLLQFLCFWWCLFTKFWLFITLSSTNWNQQCLMLMAIEHTDWSSMELLRSKNSRRIQKMLLTLSRPLTYYNLNAIFFLKVYS